MDKLKENATEVADPLEGTSQMYEDPDLEEKIKRIRDPVTLSQMPEILEEMQTKKKALVATRKTQRNERSPGT